MKKLILSLVAILSVLTMKADDGMWLLKELNKQSAARMKELGFKFPINKLYSEENPSLKDAVVIFGRGCTGVAVSNQGMIFTNHHCGYDAIQQLSSVEHDYLKDGFASHSFGEELPAPGLTVSFLQRTEDVTDLILKDLPVDMDEVDRDEEIDRRSKAYEREVNKDEFTKAQIIPFYAGNKYFLVVYEVFKDVRMVFAPPSSVGKFGGETDNWMWPRHTGDFSVFRVYANKDNKAANYSKDNVPYKPKYSVPVSLKGYKEGDYSMTIGYPGSTERYIPSWGITQMVESEHKPRIAVRGAKQDIWKADMNANDAIRIKYASKYAQSSNYWKNAMGMNAAIEKLRIISDKEKLEADFTKWVNSDAKNKAKYGSTLATLEKGYTETMDAKKMLTYFSETFYGGIEIVRFAATANSVKTNVATNTDEYLEKLLSKYYKDYEVSLDRKVMPALMKLYAESVPAEYLPSVYAKIENEFASDYNKYAEWLYNNTQFAALDKVKKAVAEKSIEELAQDPAIELANSLQEVLSKIYDVLDQYTPLIEKGNREYMAGLMEMNPKKAFSPDANFTQRLSYGSIGGYKPADGVIYDYYTTQQGIFDKEKPGDPEFNVQQYILDEIKSGNFGEYANKDGKMYVNFLSNNDITGGNSGSPVFDGNAQLIGLAFDGNWEALSGDIMFNPELQRMISVDIRYVLYTIDKVMKCPRLIEELKVIK